MREIQESLLPFKMTFYRQNIRQFTWMTPIFIKKGLWQRENTQIRRKKNEKIHLKHKFLCQFQTFPGQICVGSDENCVWIHVKP